MQRRTLLSTLPLLCLPGVTWAQGSNPEPGMTDGEVRKIDRAQAKVTLRHGPITHLEMPAMTMVFRVADPALLDGLKPGDKMRFRIERIDGNYTVTAIAPPQ